MTTPEANYADAVIQRVEVARLKDRLQVANDTIANLVDCFLAECAERRASGNRSSPSTRDYSETLERYGLDRNRGMED
jgi:hypothetical protein